MENNTLCFTICNLLLGHIYSLYGLGTEMVVSGSQDGTACTWDLRSASPVSVIHSPSKGILIAVKSICNYTVLRFDFKTVSFLLKTSLELYRSAEKYLYFDVHYYCL